MDYVVGALCGLAIVGSLAYLAYKVYVYTHV